MSKNTNTNPFWLRFHRHQRRKTYHITVWHYAVESFCSAIWTTGSRCRRPPHCHWWNRRTGTCCWRRIRYKEQSTVSERRELWYHHQYVSTLSEHAAAKNRGVRGPSLRRLARRRHYLLPHVQVLPELRRVLRVHSEEEGREEARSSMVRPETDSHADGSSKNASWYLMVLQVRSDHLAWEWHKAKTVRTMRIEALGSSSGEIHLRCRSWGGDKLDVSDKLLTVWRVSPEANRISDWTVFQPFLFVYHWLSIWWSLLFYMRWTENKPMLISDRFLSSIWNVCKPRRFHLRDQTYTHFRHRFLSSIWNICMPKRFQLREQTHTRFRHRFLGSIGNICMPKRFRLREDDWVGSSDPDT